MVGIQAILAPGQGAQLDMEKSVESDWFGQQTAAEQFRVDAPFGQRRLWHCRLRGEAQDYRNRAGPEKIVCACF